MSAKCKYGDVESAELVSCKYNEESGSISCPQPKLRPTATRSTATNDQKTTRFEMDIQFEGENGISKKRTIIAEYDSDDSDDPLVGKLKGAEKLRRATENEQRSREPWPKVTKKMISILLADLIGEMIGTFFLTLVITTIVASAVITGAQSGLWQVAIVCGVGVSLSIYCTAHFSDAHLNPAITLAFAVVRWKTFSWKRAIPYMVAQLLGGFCAGGVTFGIYAQAIAQYEQVNNITRGSNNSVITAMLFGEYYPNPSLYDFTREDHLAVISTVEAMFVEAWTTCVLAFVIFCFTDKNNTAVGSGNSKVAVPVLIGITVAVMISLYGSLTQVGMNPARDFGPRIFAAIAGWGEIAIPGPRSGFWVYIVGPLFGAVGGAAVYDFVVSNVLILAKAAKNKPVSTDN